MSDSDHHAPAGAAARSENTALRLPPLIDAEAGTAPAPTPLGNPRAIILALSLLLVALNLRPAVTSVGAVLPEVIRSVGLSSIGASVLTTLPVLCFGVFGPLAPALARRLGTERAILASLATLVVGLGMRGVPYAGAIFLGQILASLAIGIMNVLLPGLMKRDFPHRLPLMTGAYTMGLCAGAALGAGATVPLADVPGSSWSRALAFWAIPAAVAALFWAGQMPPREGGSARVAYRVAGLWSDSLAWQVTLFMGLQSALAFTVFGWLAPILRDRGLTAADAGMAVSISVIVQAVAALFAPVIATRGKDQRPSCVASVALCIAGFLGCIYGPLWSVWLWAVVLGVAQGSLFALALTLIVLRAPDAHVAAHLSSMAQSVGYTVAATGPLLTGLLHGWFQSWTPVALLFAGLSLAAALAAIGAGRSVYVGATSTRLPV